MLNWMLTKVVSGGQTGVDRIAQDTARQAGLPIGGWCPRGRLAEDGPIADHYPLRETPSEEYAERTEWNVRDSDGTLILTYGAPSGGTAHTINTACRLRRPCRIVNLEAAEETAAGALQWLREHRVGVLNVAGPRAQNLPDDGAGIRAYLQALFQRIAQLQSPGKRQRLERFAEVDIYPVTCEELSNGRRDAEVLEAIIAGGARIVQLRDKRASKRELFAKAEHFRAVTAAHGVLLIINDHLDVAMAVGADGVHLGLGDLPVAAARRLVPELIIGASTHSLADAWAAEADGADYINIGPIYTTGTKEGLSTFLGPEAISRIGPRVGLPFTVMGGIKLANLGEVLAAGARHVAVVTAITQAEDMVAATAELKQRIQAERLPA